MEICENCSRCEKPPELCVCESIRPLSTRIHVLILQHPQEPDQHLGSAQLAHLSLPNSTLTVGLSWPNIKKALGKDVQSSHWAVLYLGSGIKGEDGVKAERSTTPAVRFVDKAGKPAPETPIEGIIVLDGSWSQAKTLWWRNAWLLKCKRLILTPRQKSLYKELRKEPRRECLSTIESVAETLTALGEKAETENQLKALFGELLNKQRAILKKRN